MGFPVGTGHQTWTITNSSILILSWQKHRLRQRKSTPKEARQQPLEFLRDFVAAAVRTGLEPAKIYAAIKTGRILTKENMKLLTKADIKEWQDAAREYDKLANTKTAQ